MIDLGLMPDAQAQAWGTLVALYQIVPGNWTVVGGQMVYAHCMDRGYTGARPTTDADTVLDVRARGTILYEFSAALGGLGFTPERNNVSGHQSHWQRDGVRVDVMIPTGLGLRAVTRPGVTGATALQTPGAQKALNRTGTVEVTWDGFSGGTVPLPSMLGALVAKSRAFQVDRQPGRDRHLEDLLVLAQLARPKDALRDADRAERRTLMAGLRNAASFARSRSDDAALDSLEAVAMMAQVDVVVR